MAALAEEFRKVRSRQLAVFAAKLAIGTTRRDLATALRMRALFLGHTYLRGTQTPLQA
jgi:hypothetical protein